MFMEVNMKSILTFASILFLLVFSTGCTSIGKAQINEKTEPNEEQPEAVKNDDSADESAVTKLVEEFGKKLQMVSLQAPKDVLEKSMKENYGDYVSQQLISKWISDPLNAPGRLTSSPWPDRIEIQNVRKVSEDTYEVKGSIIEITSEEKTEGGAALKRPVTITVKKLDNRFLIDDVSLGAYDKSDSK
jgi:hypothetical protein